MRRRTLARTWSLSAMLMLASLALPARHALADKPAAATSSPPVFDDPSLEAPPPPPAPPPPAVPAPTPPPAVMRTEGEAPVVVTPVARPPHVGQKADGFAFEARLGTGILLQSNVAGQSGTTLLSVSGALFAGYKWERLTVGLGFDISRVSSGASQPNLPDMSTSATAVLFTPGLRVALLRSHDQRVELFAELDLGFGHTFSDQTPAPVIPPTQPTTDHGNFTFLYDVGPGLRYWVHPQFAVGMVTLLRGTYQFLSTTSTFNMMSTTTSSNLTQTSILGALQFLGVF